jgi:hypothetical protein
MRWKQFKVYTPQDEETYDAGTAHYSISDHGVLEVWPGGAPDPDQKITYGPAGWFRVDEHTLEYEPPGPQSEEEAKQILEKMRAEPGIRK